MITKRNKGNRGVIALLTILGVGFLALGSALAMTSGVLLNLVTGHNMVYGNQSVYTAEAAATEGAYQHGNIPSYTSGSPSLINNTSAGSITITDLPSYHFESKSIVSNGRTERHVIKTFTTCPSCEAFSYGLYSAGSGLSLGGGATINGSVYSNQNLNLSGNSVINGNAFAVGTISVSNGSTISGAIISNASLIPAPTVDYVVLKNPPANVFSDDPPSCHGGGCQTAEQKAQSYINSHLNSNPPAIVYIETKLDVSITVASTFTGTIITAPPTGNSPGDLTIKGTFTAAPHYPAIVTQGTLKLSGGTNINGLAYVQGDINTTGSNQVINGGIILTNTSASPSVQGGIVITYNPAYFQDIENFYGLNIPSSGGVKFLNWREE